MNRFVLQDLLSKVALSDQESTALANITPDEMRGVLRYLEAQGVTPAQVQWLLKVPFSGFEEYHLKTVMWMALALQKGKLTPADLHKILQDRELWAQMHNATTLFITEALPSAADIDARLGITPPQEFPAPLSSPARLPLPAIDTGAGDLFF